MSKKEIQTNFNMSAEFTQYTLKHPGILSDIPKNAQIILVPKNNMKLAEKNIELGEKIKKNEQKSVVQAIKVGNKWSIEPLKA